jgi:ribulose-bisphosphate carboxylase large chain
MGPLNRYIDRNLHEGELISKSEHFLVACMLEHNECQGPVYYQKWHGLKATTPIISSVMNALRLPVFFANLSNVFVINTARGGAFGHLDSQAAGARSLRQAYACWKAGDATIEWAREHRELARAFDAFPDNADRLFPGVPRQLRRQ